MGFTFNEPLTKGELAQFITTNQLDLLTEYQNFLLLHNGVEFFTYEYGYSFCLYSIQEMLREYHSLKEYCEVQYILNYCCPIGYMIDHGTLLVDLSNSNILLMGMRTIRFYCDLTTWIERMLISQGNAYWEWYAEEVDFD